MVRRIIQIDREKCNGCGLCAKACHEGAIGMVDGKAQLMRDDYCDGLGDCLPVCPTNAIRFIEREAAAYDEAAVKANQAKKAEEAASCGSFGGCMSSQAKTLEEQSCQGCGPVFSRLRQWPVQIQLVPVNAPYFDGAHVLIAADCTAYACGNFHQEYMAGKITLIGCPKLDPVDYSEKLSEIFRTNDVKSVTVTRMMVPCCGGMENAVRRAVEMSGKQLSLRIVVLTPDGKVLEERA